MAFAVRRAGEHLARLLLLALVVGVVVAGIGGIDAAADRMLTDGASRVLADAEPAARTVRVTALEAADGDAQDAAVRRAVDDAFGDLDVTVSRLTMVESAVDVPGEEEVTLRLRDDARIPDLAALTAGEWPRSPWDIALAEAAADRLDLAVGDTVTVGGAALTVVGSWTASDPTDPAWYGDPAVASGQSGGVVGPAAVAPGALADLPDTPTITWEIAPTGTDLADLPRLQRALADLRSLPDAVDPQRQRSTRVIGALGDTVQRQTAAVGATRGLLIAPQLSIGLLGALVFGIVLSAQVTAREEELVLLRARGASGRRLAGAAAIEAAVFSAAGALVALVALAYTTGVTAAVLLAAAGATGFAALVAAILTVRTAARADIVRPGAERSDAGARSVRMLLVPAGIAVALAALSGAQLFGTGGIIRGGGAPDPLAASAPALLLVAACALAPLIAGPLAAVLERALRRSSGIAPVLPLRQISRRMGSTAVAILCLALAAASVAVAVAAPAQTDAAEQRTRTALLGWDVRVIAEGGLDTDADAASTWTGVSDVAEVLHTPLTIGSDLTALIAAPPRALGLADPLPSAADGTVPAAVTRSLAERLGAREGTVFTARIRGVARPVKVTVDRIVDAVPGVGGARGVAVAPEALQAAGVDLAPDELWLRTGTPDTVAAQLRAEATHPVRILTVAQVSSAPVTAVAPVLLAAGAMVAAVLGLIGFLAASSATARERRGEAFVLDALGLAPARRRALRTGETAGVAVYAVLAGAVLGAVVAALVLPVVLGVGS